MKNTSKQVCFENEVPSKLQLDHIASYNNIANICRSNTMKTFQNKRIMKSVWSDAGTQGGDLTAGCDSSV